MAFIASFHHPSAPKQPSNFRSVTTPVSRRPTLPGITRLNSQYRDWSGLGDQNEDTKQKAQYLYTATQHLTQHRDRNASDNSMNTTPADLQITAETKVLHKVCLKSHSRLWVIINLYKKLMIFKNDQIEIWINCIF